MMSREKVKGRKKGIIAAFTDRHFVIVKLSWILSILNLNNYSIRKSMTSS